LTVGEEELVDLSEYKTSIAGSGINFQRRWLAANRDATVDFLKAMIEVTRSRRRTTLSCALLGQSGTRSPIRNSRTPCMTGRQNADKPLS